MQPYWKRAEWLDGEIQSLMQTSELTVYLDEPHNCIHIMRGNCEFHSALFPLNDSIREDLRQAAYLLHNALDGEERQRIKEANEKMEAYGERQQEEVKADVRDFGVWTYKHLFENPQNTPMIIMDGDKK
jgi:hypothetical protein